MNIVFTVNNSYIPQLLCVIVSILENNKTKINFYVLHSDITAENQEKFEKLKNKYKNFDITFLQIDDSKVESLPRTISYISKECYYRYLIADILKKDKALYLDADIVVNGNIENFYNTNIDQYFCAGVEDKYIEEIKHKKTIDFSEQDLYINAGVLLLNLKKMREFNISDKLIQNTINYQNVIKFQDQDIINITFKNKILGVDSIYNFTAHNIIVEENKIKKAVIIHYTGSLKPWSDVCNNKLKNVWLKYYDKTIKISENKNDKNYLKNILSIRKSLVDKRYRIITIFGFRFLVKTSQK